MKSSIKEPTLWSLRNHVELDVFLLERLSPLTQIDEEHLVLTIAIANHLAILLHRAGLLVIFQNPKGHADISRIEHVARQKDNSLYQMVLKQLLTDSQFCAVATQCTIGKKEACCSVWEQY